LLWAARPIELLRGLNIDRPAIVHFAGHADARGLMLADDEEGHVAVSGANLSLLLGSMSGVTRLVVLNACLTDEQSQALVDTAGCVIAMQSPIGDVDARRFSQALYAALAKGQSVYSAFGQAVALLAIHYQGALGPRDVAAVSADASLCGPGPILRTRADVDARILCFRSGQSTRAQISRRWRKGWALCMLIASLVLSLTVVLVSRTDEPSMIAQITQIPAGTQISVKDQRKGSLATKLWSRDPDCNLVRINEVWTRAEDLAVVIDLTMHNIGNRVANVTRIRVGEKKGKISSNVQVAPVRRLASAEYPLEWNENSNELIISHVMLPDEVDRIIVRVYLDKSYDGKYIGTSIRMKYNQTCWTVPEFLEFTAPKHS
jgi:hypothetical protein